MSKIVDMLTDIFEQGYTIDELKKSCLQALGPFFEDKSVLEKYWTSSELLSAFEFIIRYHDDTIFAIELQKILECYRDALSKNETLVIDIISETLFDFSQKENMMFSVRQDMDNVSDGSIFEKTMCLMKHIGETLEIGTKHLVCELWSMVRIQEGIIPDYEKICSLDFGVVVQNFLDKSKFLDLFKTNSIAIKLSDWRNIAYHHTYRVIGDKISCSYGKNGASFTMGIQDLEQYAHQVVRSSNVLNIARSIFIFESIGRIQKHKKKPANISNIYFRDDLLHEGFRISLLSQSFLLDKVELSDNIASITIIDLLCASSESDTDRKRRIHSTQFLYEVWRIYDRASVEVKYATVQEGVCFLSSVGSDICKKIGSGEENISYLAEHFAFSIIEE